MKRHSIDTQESSEDSTARSSRHQKFQRLRVEEDESSEEGRSDTRSNIHEQFREVDDVKVSNQDTLDCDFCHKSLSGFLFECFSGHIVCASCRSKPNLCAICKSCTRRRYAKSKCDYKSYGCKEVVKYTERYAHNKSCHFSPCLCPQKDCNFRANSAALGEHFRTSHRLHAPRFKYGEFFFASVHKRDNVTILQGISDGELFVITCKTCYITKKLNLYHIGPTRHKPEYVFELFVLPQDEDRDPILTLKAEAVNVDDRAYRPSTAIFVSYRYFKAGCLSLKLRICKIGESV